MYVCILIVEITKIIIRSQAFKYLFDTTDNSLPFSLSLYIYVYYVYMICLYSMYAYIYGYTMVSFNIETLNFGTNPPLQISIIKFDFAIANFKILLKVAV